MQDSPIKFCPACGAQNNYAANFCNMCGAQTPTPHDGQQEQVLQEEKALPDNDHIKREKAELLMRERLKMTQGELDDIRRKKAQESLATKIGFGIVVIVLAFIVFGKNRSSRNYTPSLNSDLSSRTSPTPTSPEARPRIDAPEIQARIQRGRQLFEKLRPKIPGGQNPSVSGHLTAVPTLTFYVTNELWDKLSKKQQIDLTWYFESFIPTAKSQPERHAFISPSAPFYPQAIELTRNLCSDCWEITVGDPAWKNGKLTMTVDRTPIKGDTPWKNKDSYSRSLRASEFRAIE